MQINMTTQELLELLGKHAEGVINNVPADQKAAGIAGLGELLQKENAKAKQDPGQGGGITI
jgi:hypothetical protein